ncbi:MAG: hypothetical protein WDN08_02035 [Rhizomicrobium sp.]
MTAQPQRMGHDARTNLRYIAEMLGATLLLAATTIAAHRLPLDPRTTLYITVQLIPVLAVWLLPLVMYRHYRRIDELQRLQFLQAIAITAGVMVGAAWSWPSLQRAFQLQMQPGMWEVYSAIVFSVVTALVNLRHAAPRAG